MNSKTSTKNHIINKTSTLKTAAALSVAVLVSGCQSLPNNPNQSAHEAFTQSLEQSLQQNSYNFRFEQKFALSPKKVMVQTAEAKAAATGIATSATAYDDCDDKYSTALASATVDTPETEIEAAYQACLDAADAAADAAGEAVAATAGEAVADGILDGYGEVKTYDECDADYEDAITSVPASVVASENAGAEEAYLKEQAQIYSDCLLEAEDAAEYEDPYDDDYDSDYDDTDFEMTPERIDAINAYVLNPLSIIMDGAYDAKARQMQFTYELNYQPKNLTISAKLPMLIDLNDLSITLDPALALPILGVAFSEDIGTKWQDKSVKFYVPKEIAEKIPTDIITSAFTKAMIHAYGKIDPNEFSFGGIDSFAKQVHARRVIDMKMTPKTQLTLLDNLVVEAIHQVELEAKAHPEKIKDPESFEEFLGMAKEIAGKGIFGKDGLLSQQTDSEDMTQFMSPADTKLYLDGRGNMVGFSAVQNLNMLAELLNADIVATTTGTVSNYGNAKFSYRPSSDAIIDGNTIVKKLMDERADQWDDDAYEDDSGLDASDAYYDALDACMEEKGAYELDSDAYDAVDTACRKVANEAYYGALPYLDAVYERAYDACIDAQPIDDMSDEDYAELETKCEGVGDEAYNEAEANTPADAASTATEAAEAAAEAAADAIEGLDRTDAPNDAEDTKQSALLEFCTKETKYKNSELCKQDF